MTIVEAVSALKAGLDLEHDLSAKDNRRGPQSVCHIRPEKGLDPPQCHRRRFWSVQLYSHINPAESAHLEASHNSSLKKMRMLDVLFSHDLSSHCILP